MSHRLSSNYQPSSQLDSKALLQESVHSQSAYSKSYYPLKSLSRYSRSPQKSKQNSQQNSNYTNHSKNQNKSYKTSSSKLDNAYYPESLRETKQSMRDRESYYTQKSHSKNFKKSEKQSKISKKRSKRESQISQGQYSKRTNKRYEKESFVTNESDYERFLRERYPDMVKSTKESHVESRNQRSDISYPENSQVRI